MAALLCAWAVQPAIAAPELGRPRRLIHWFDFEERQLGNFEKMPRYWFAIGRDPQIADPTFMRQPVHEELIHRLGFPSFTEVRFDRQQFTSGEHAFYLKLNGGSAGAFLQNGAIPAVPDSDYLITANVRTQKLRLASTRLSAYFIDKSGQRIDASVARTEPIRTNEQWTAVAVRLSGEHAEADYIGIEIELLQPRPDAADPLGKHQVMLQDVEGEAWFDDIVIWQLPHVEIATQSEVNVIRAPQRPRLTLNVRDLTGQRLHADLVVYDHALKPIAQQRRVVGGGQPNTWGWTPDLPGFGWYLTDLRIFHDDQYTGKPVSRTIGALLWMPNDTYPTGAEAQRFALVAENLPDSHLTMLPTLMKAGGLNMAVISAWSPQTTLTNLVDRQDRLDELVFDIRAGGGAVVLSLEPVPRELARSQGVDTSQPLAVLQADEQTWLPYLTPVMMRHGQRVHHWQLGTAHQPFAFFYDNLPRILAQVERRFRALTPQPNLMLPWRIDQSRRVDVATDSELAYAMDVPVSVTPEHLSEYLKSWQASPASLWLHLRSPRADQVAHPRRINDIVLRMVHGWEAGATGLAIDQPWTLADERRPALLPDPVFGAFSNTAHRLAGRRVLGRLLIEEGVECMILDGEPGGMLVAWNRRAAEQHVLLEMYLGQSPVAIDIWGNRTSVPRVDGKHHLVIGPTPVFIEGIDPELALFRASFSVEPPFIESEQQPHGRTITLTNPWSRTINGQMQIYGPPGWQSQPARNHFTIAAGQTIKLPLTFTFPIAEVAGPKKLQARFVFTADQQYEVDLSAPMELGLKDVQFEANLAIEPGIDPGTRDAVVVALVTNTGVSPKSLFVFAALSEHPRQEIPISQLAPGQTVLRTFRFHNVDLADSAPVVRAGVRQTNGPAMLNVKLTPDEMNP